jgi:hypothetical protein
VPDTTIEEAQRCTTCLFPGRVAQTMTPGHLPRGTRVLVVECPNDRCKFYLERWLVQINPNGTIPEYKRGPKQFDLPGQHSALAVRSREELELIDYMTRHPQMLEEEARQALGGYRRHRSTGR